MTLGSFVHGALTDLTVEDLDRMLTLDETLFVEHKSDIGRDTTYNLVKAVAAFANTLGGWLLIGVRDGRPVESEEGWAQADRSPTLVDALRDRLRGELDPLPAFEAKVITHPDGPVGVVRVYESSDTPHVALRTGSVFVREVAGDTDASNPGRPGPGARGRRIYGAAQIRSRSQLLELAARGRTAVERVNDLVDPIRPLPLIANELGLKFEQIRENQVQPRLRSSQLGTIFVRLAPYTLAPRFQAWATTAEASAGALSAVEQLAQRHGLDNSWRIPDPSGVAIRVPLESGARHCDAASGGLDAVARVVLDGAGVAAAALELAGPEDQQRRSRVPLDTLARDLIRPTVQAAAHVLMSGEMLGRVWCQIDLVGLSVALLLEGEGNQSARYWVPTGADLALPIDDEQLDALVRRAANAYARSAGLHAWDPPTAA